MRLLEVSKDGGPESTVWAYWLVEIKWLFSIVLLRFENGSRDAYHDHAFNSVSWVLSGRLHEEEKGARENAPVDDWKWYTDVHVASPFPVITRRNTFHKVTSIGRSWVLSFRGPWAKTWHEYDPKTGVTTTLTHGRVKT